MTVAGLAVAIAAVVSLVGAAESLENSYLALYESRGGDLVVQRRGGAVQVSRGMSESFGNRIRTLPQAGVVTGGLLDIVSFEDQGLYTVFVEGLPQDDEAVLGRIKVLSGRRLESSDKDCVMLGRVLAANIGKRAGETVEIYVLANFRSSVCTRHRTCTKTDRSSCALPICSGRSIARAR